MAAQVQRWCGFEIDSAARVFIEDEEFDVVESGVAVTVLASKATGELIPYKNSELSAAINSGDIIVARGQSGRPAPAGKNAFSFLDRLPPKEQDVIRFKLEWIWRYQDKLESEGAPREDDAAIPLMDQICAEYKADLEAATKNASYKPVKLTYASHDFHLKRPGPSTLRSWERVYRTSGKDAMALRDHRGTGLRVSRFTPEELRLQAHFLQRYCSTLKLSPQYLFNLMKALERRLNKSRTAQGWQPLNLGGRSHFYERIASLPDWVRYLVQEGETKTRLKYMPVQGSERGYPMDIQEGDEARIDLVALLKTINVFDHLTKVEQEAYRKASQRFWFSAIIDRATNVFVAFRIHEQSPSTETALATFRHTTHDKSDIAKAAGCKSKWDMYGGARTVRLDSAAWYKSTRLSSSLTDSGVTKIHPPTKMSALRGTVERMFRVIASLTLENFSGKTFSSIVKRGDSDPRAGASVDRHMLEQVFIRAIVDIHHNTRSFGKLGGMTPRQAWNAGCKTKRPPAPPTGWLRRNIYGTNLSRVITKEGITVMGFKFRSDETHGLFMKNTGKPVDIRVDLEDFGEITVFDGPNSYRVPARLPALRGRSYWQLTAALDDLGVLDETYAARTQEDVDEAFEFIDQQGEVARAMLSLSSPIITSEHIDRVERRIRRHIHITPEAEIRSKLRKQDWQRSSFLDEAWGLSDAPEGDDLDVPASASAEAVAKKYGSSGSSKTTSYVRKVAPEKEAMTAETKVSPLKGAPTEPPKPDQINYYEEF
ncbi:Mu transposase C-terminal domain-containing protein [Endobacterium cereale]|uniref:Mu transposase C-terminal domain-containing protein n=1 Tax=Endobacterium cereale TaxID=2663029 RepID=UPI002B481CD5|nr:Mu transposase C-terminal domain-containing protein [Endobacterium cereale]MEB2845980.1 Mu transposase C-terminal domain-containing protein [Endobacterium cereale]